ncbi:glycoside hydrolase 43 family protein [uncultured Prevotella sp.]|uniref:glycoside hydrolase family 43 protein n=1 Tax=uncultured Prevotella sp. TaxID=159272 RepID=UPI00261D69C4|nr:glycoside hydrolase 43 family protein [uncultured Prevotella sp.]
MLFSGILLTAPLSAYAQYHSQVWNPDNGNGTYTNPVLYADYSDPDVVAVGDDFYLTASSFNCIPGLPILHSNDLVNWQIIGYALQEQEPKPLFDLPQHGKGVWAPAIRHHNGELYIYWGDPDHGIFMVKTKDPRGKWDSPVCVLAGKGMIDPCPMWDEDGKCYLVNGWAGSRSGFNSVLTIRQLSADGTKAIGKPRIVFDGGQLNHTTEGPKLYKRDGYYWIMCPAGGVKHGWQLAMRSKNIYGPYEARKVMAQGKTNVNGPHQGAWVHTAQGEDWFLHFNDKGAYGRVVFLQPVDWKTGWPVMGNDKDGDGCGEPYLSYRMPKAAKHTKVNPQESDEFDSTELGLQWQWHANYNELWGMPTNNGCLRLYTADLAHPATANGDGPTAFKSLWEAGNLLLQKTPAKDFCVTTKMRFASKEDNQYGGVIMMGMNYQALVVRRMGDSFLLQQLHCKDADAGGVETQKTLATLKPTERDTIPYSPAIYLDIYMQMRVKDGKCQFAYSLDDKRYKDVGDVFGLRQGKWIGAKMGYVSERSNTKGNRGWIDADWFRVTK